MVTKKNKKEIDIKLAKELDELEAKLHVTIHRKVNKMRKLLRIPIRRPT